MAQRATILMAAGALALVPAGAAADDLGLRRSVYLGVHDSITWSLADAVDFGGYSGTSREETGVNDRAFSGGLHAGFDLLDDTFFVGLVMDLNLAGNHGRATSAGAPDLVYANDIGWYGTLRARAGANLDPVRLYATAGFALAGVEMRLFDVDPLITPTTVLATRSRNQAGWTVGAGAEVDLSDHVALGLEYLFIGLDPLEVAPTASDAAVYRFKQDIDLHIAKLMLTYRF